MCSVSISRLTAAELTKKIPEFKSEDDERKFWASADSTEYVDRPSGTRTTPAGLKPSLKRILQIGEPGG
jgi:hypothetical protein